LKKTLNKKKKQRIKWNGGKINHGHVGGKNKGLVTNAPTANMLPFIFVGQQKLVKIGQGGKTTQNIPTSRMNSSQKQNRFEKK